MAFLFASHFSQYSSEIFICILVILLFVRISRFFRNQQTKCFPPGPTGLPIVGYLPFLTKDPHLKLQVLTGIYGEIFSLKFGSLNVVVLSSSNVITEAFGKSEFLGRPDKSIFSLMDVEKPFFISGPVWYEQRQLALQILKTLQRGQTEVNKHIQDEIDHFVRYIDSDKMYDIEELITPAVSNCICALLFGQRYEYNDPERLLLDQAINDANRYIAQTSIFMVFPWLSKIPFLTRLMKLNLVTEAFDSLKEFIRKKISEHKMSMNPENLHDFIDHYLHEINNQGTKEEKSTSSSEKMLLGSIMALFGGASSTLRSSISWCFYVMAVYPEIQKKVQQEIDEVIGSEKTIIFADQKNMPYTQSVIMEIQRLQTVLPLGVLRVTVDETELGGYTIPKDTVVIPNVWTAHRSSSCWKSPEDFLNERFLSDDGEKIIKPNSFLPFSYGKRSCPGEGFATAAMFLFFTSVLREFTVTVKDKDTALKGSLALTYQPRMPKAMFIRRSDRSAQK